MTKISLMEDIFLTLPTVTTHHKPGSKLYALLRKISRQEIETLFSGSDEAERNFEPFGALIFPYFKMGAIDSLNLFDMDELIIFSFYLTNRQYYNRFLDIGANIGLHSILGEKCGFDVRSYEPDPFHFERFKKNIEINKCKHIKAFNAAVSSKSGKAEFIRVLGNTTASHLSGSKKDPYGDLEKFTVDVESIANLMAWADLVKIDAEGHEKEILLATTREQWLDTDAIVEIENEQNAEAVYNHLNSLEINLFPQKIRWERAVKCDDLPKSYHDGSLFITAKDSMPWISE